MKAKQHNCPVCGLHIRDFKVVGTEHTAKPRPGDFVICNQCVTMLTFDSDTEVQRLTTAQFEALSKDWQTDLNSAILTILKNHPNGKSYKTETGQSG